MAHDTHPGHTHEPHSHGPHSHGPHSHGSHSDGGHSHGTKGHDHSHGHGHAHHHAGPATRGDELRMLAAAVITGLFLIAEIVGGLISGSLALLADAGHMSSDFASLILAWVGFRIARRPADTRRTYGFRRVAVLAAFVNGLALIAVAVWILIEAAIRLFQPSEVLAGTMLWIAIGGLVVNIIAFAILHGGDRENLNMRGALLHVMGDLLGSVAAIAASVIILFTNWVAADPILSALIALILIRSAWSLVSDSGHVLLEGAPTTIDVEAVSADLAEHVEGVIDVHHAHAWSLDGRHPLMTLHARISDTARGPDVIARIKARLKSRHGVDHATVEIEHEDCPDRPDADAAPSCG